MKVTSMLTLTVIISLTTGLHLHYETLTIYTDNLEESNQCYYFGKLEQTTYYTQQNKYKHDNPSYQSCPPSIPYANVSNAHHSCYACEEIKKGIDVTKAKVLFNAETRQCEVCASGKNKVCDQLIKGTYTFPGTSGSSTTTASGTTTTASGTTTTASGTTTTTSGTTTTTSGTTPTSSTTNTSTTTTSQTTSSTTASSPNPTPENKAQTTSTQSTVQQTTTSTQPTASSSQSTTPTTASTSTTKVTSQTAGNCPPERPLYRQDTKLCDSCPGGTEFIGTKQECVPKIYVTNPETKDLILSNLTELIEYNKKIQKQHPEQVVEFCPTDTPYAQLNKCIKCSYQNQYFYVTTQACVTGCPEGTYYDQRVMQCAPALFYSDVNAPGIVSQSDSYDKWKAEVDYQAKSSPRMTQCSSHKPFQQNGTCISCDGSYFDIDQRKCVSCSRGREYNSSKRKCVGIVSWDHSMKTFASGVV